MGRALEITTGLANWFGINTHFRFGSSAYQAGGHPIPNALTVVRNSGATVFRELADNHAPQNEAITALAPMKIYGTPADINDGESKVRALIHAISDPSNPLRNSYYAFPGSNEPNDRFGGWHGTGSWYVQALKQQYWIWDQVQIEVAAGRWNNTPGTTGGRPLIIGPALMAAAGLSHGGADGEGLLDTDIGNLAAATFTIGSSPPWAGGRTVFHLADLCDQGDLHYYPGKNGSGLRVNGKDSNNVLSPGIVLGSDGKCSMGMYQLQRVRRSYDIKGGTSGHGATFKMNHSEWGYQHTGDGGSGWTAEEWQAYAAMASVDTLLRDFGGVVLDDEGKGVRKSIVYQALNDAISDPKLGIYDQTAFPDGAYPIYTALQKLVSYSGAESFTSIGSLAAISGVESDAGVYVFSLGSGHWDIYITREAQTKVHLVLDTNHRLLDHTLDGGGFYEVILSTPTTILSVIPNDSLPTWKRDSPPDGNVGSLYSYAFKATGATSYGIVDSADLPPGLAINATTGVLSGTPTTGGSYTFQVSATNSAGTIFSPDLVVLIGEVPTFVNFDPPDGTVGVSYRYTFTADGFPDPTFSLDEPFMTLHAPNWVRI